MSESFFHTLKTELLHQQTFHSREEAKQAVFEYIEVFYTGSDYIQLMDIYRLLTSSCSKMLLNFVSSKVLTHQSIAASTSC